MSQEKNMVKFNMGSSRVEKFDGKFERVSNVLVIKDNKKSKKYFEEMKILRTRGYFLKKENETAAIYQLQDF